MADDEARLRHMRDAAAEAVAFARNESRERLDQNRLLLLALVKCLEIVGEATGRVSEPTQLRMPDVPWSRIRGMRNRLIHGYFDVDPDIVWKTVTDELPALIDVLDRHLSGPI